MTMFTFEDRVCVCGRTWSALAFWSEDLPCPDCSRADYEQRLAGYSDRLGFPVVSIGGACPTQAEGRYPSGRPFYFRARHGSWTLEVGQPGDPIGYGEWPGEPVFVDGGNDPSHGSMDDEDVLRIVAANAEVQPHPSPTHQPTEETPA